MTGCTAEFGRLAPNHLGVKPGYEINTCKHFDPVHKYKIEGQLDWNW
jgi:hypothetical protein